MYDYQTYVLFKIVEHFKTKIQYKNFSYAEELYSAKNLMEQST